MNIIRPILSVEISDCDRLSFNSSNFVCRDFKLRSIFLLNKIRRAFNLIIKIVPAINFDDVPYCCPQSYCSDFIAAILRDSCSPCVKAPNDIAGVRVIVLTPPFAFQNSIAGVRVIVLSPPLPTKRYCGCQSDRVHPTLALCGLLNDTKRYRGCSSESCSPHPFSSSLVLM